MTIYFFSHLSCTCTCRLALVPDNNVILPRSGFCSLRRRRKLFSPAVSRLVYACTPSETETRYPSATSQSIDYNGAVLDRGQVYLPFKCGSTCRVRLGFDRQEIL